MSGLNYSENNYRPRLSTVVLLMMLFGLMLSMLFISALFSNIISNLFHFDSRTATLTGAIFQNIFAFIIPAVITAYFSGVKISTALSIRRAPTLRTICGIILVMVCSVPAFETIVAWNENLHLPESMHGLEEQLRAMEQTAADATAGILDAGSFGAMLAGVAIIGILTGIGEEFFFRAGLQKTLCAHNWVRPCVAIWTAAVIFSAMHFQFFGFVPRLLMGVFFGYLLFWTDSIWNCIIAHALNNSVVVVSAWLETTERNILTATNMTESAGYSWFWIAVSVCGVALILFPGRKIFFTKADINT